MCLEIFSEEASCGSILVNDYFPYATTKLGGRLRARGGRGYCHIWAIWVCAAVKGMVFKQFTLG